MSEVRTTFRLKTGDPAPDFSLPDPDGQTHSLKDLMGGKGTLIAFVCNHCPFVIHLADALKSFANDAADLGVNTVAISSNDVENYPQDRPEKMKEFADEHGWEFPYLYDESQDVALAYGAACTPDFFLFDAEGQLFYTGQFDDSRPNKGTPDGKDLREALKLLVSKQSPPDKVYPSSGCNIKWKPDVKPEWWNAGNA
ncbi:MAG: thioredoxin family protein [Akkermansiaceae bacterium]|nr:thioredoxin family protein [Akkermansiaceae bacterium]